MGDFGTILGVFAHPDDEAYLLAGIMASSVRAGRRVALWTATRGELGSWDDEKWPTSKLGDIREQEMNRSMDILGVKEHTFIGYPDAGCKDIPDEEALAALEPYFADVQPDSVFSFGPDGMTDHDDHKATCRWATEGFARWAKPGARLYYATTTPEWAQKWVPVYNRFNVFMSDDTPPVTPREELAISFELPKDLLDLKIAAINAHESQVSHMMAAFGEDVFREGQKEETWRLAAEK